MKTIFETFKKSIYNPAFYQAVRTESLWTILRYYWKVVLVLSIVMTVILGVFLVPQGVLFVKDRAPDLVKTYYPADLVVHIEKGEATANVEMPYVVPVKQITGVAPTLGALENMVVIDTVHEFDKKTFQEYKTYALLTKTEIVTQGEGGQITIQDLRGMPTTTISQGTLLLLVEKIRASMGVIVFFGLVATLVILILGYVAYLVPLFVFALVPFFVAWLKKIPLSYGEAYKISLYAILPALALKTLLNLLGIFFLPAYFTLLVFMLIIATNMREVEQPKLFN